MCRCEADEEQEEEGKGHKRETRIVMHFHPRIAPLTVAVFPLMRKPELLERLRNGVPPVKTVAEEVDEIEKIYLDIVRG